MFAVKRYMYNRRWQHPAIPATLFPYSTTTLNHNSLSLVIIHASTNEYSY